MKLFVSAAVATVAIAATGLAAGAIAPQNQGLPSGADTFPGSRGPAASLADAPPITAKIFGAATVEQPFTVRTTKSAGLLTMQVTGVPGADFGWHYHPAAAAVIVVKGRLSVYDSGDPSCSPHPYSAGQ